MNEKEYRTLYDFEESYWWFKGHRLLSFGLIDNYISAKKRNSILDVGVGAGVNMIHLKKYGTVHGCDISKEAVEFCRLRGIKNVKVCTAEKLSYPGSYFDIVTSFGVICCVNDDNKAFREMFRVCKKGAVILVTTPAIPALASFKTEHDLSQHLLRRYNKKMLEKKLRAAGFVIQKTTYFNMILCPLVVLVRILRKIFLPGVENKNAESDVKNVPGFVNQTLENILKVEAYFAKKASLPFGLTLACVGKKP